jgi:hypothetical protein
MCDYCGCRAFPLIRLLTEQHDAIEEAAGALRRAIRDGADARAWPVLDELLDLLAPHTTLEEGGLFAEVRADPTLAEAVAKLCAEHRDIHGVLRAVDQTAPDWPAVAAALDRLRRHIDNEEHGLFPAAVVALPIAVWDRITPAELPAPTG